MARANLTISDELREKFAWACDPASNVRCIRSVIRGEDIILTDDPVVLRGGDGAEADFALLASEVSEGQAMYYLFCLGEAEAAAEASWVLVAFVSDAAPVREKMLYASMHKDLVRELGGASKFKGELYCNSVAEMVYTSVLEATRSAQAAVNAPLSAEEQVLAAEAKASIGQHSEKTSGLSALPFQLTDTLAGALANLKSGDINFVEMQVTKQESIDLCSEALLDGTAALLERVNSSQARFYAVRFPLNKPDAAHLFFVLSCPEAVPIKEKMVLATVKATVLAACESAGLKFLKMLETQDPSELPADMASEIETATEDRSLRNDLAFARPKPRGGRRRPRRKKK